MKNRALLFMVIILLLMAGCTDKRNSELTIGEALDKETTIVWNSFWGYAPRPCSIQHFFAGYDTDGYITEYGFDYSYIDIDLDGKKDVIIQSENYMIQLVILKHDDKYYGVAFSEREAEYFFTSGYIRADRSGGAEAYYKIQVEEDSIVCKDIAVRTGDWPFRYYLNENEVTDQEYESWVQENCKEEITFEHYEETIPRP